MTDTENQIRGAHEVAIAKLKQTRETIAAMREQEHRIVLQIKDCEAAARLFGFEFEPIEESSKGPLKAPDNVREFTLSVLSASPRGVKANEILSAYQTQFRRSIHPKTIGMTLYRLKVAGLAQINGHVWRPSDTGSVT